jgi:ribosomal protein S18 acetylase RimI-like enzyme
MREVEIIKSDHLNEILALRKTLSFNFPNLKKKTTKIYLLNKIRDKKGYLIKAISQNKIVGFLAWLKESSKTAYIWWLVVDKKFQKNNIGSKLMKEALKDIQREGIKRVWAKIKNDNFSALALVAKFQFFVEGITNEDGIFTVVVAKNLPQAKGK